ncbi:MAG TPA: DNA-binding protein [Oceanicaulis sp.]|nr:DNA-binding protein [Oceanicaulis sp.]
MEHQIYLTAEEVAERYRNEISVGTLRNWRAMRLGPSFVKIGKAVLYPVHELDEWDRKNLVTCRTPKAKTSGGGSDEAAE